MPKEKPTTSISGRTARIAPVAYTLVGARVPKKQAPMPAATIACEKTEAMGTLLRGLADGFGHFVVGLQVFELRLKLGGLGVELASGGGFFLRTQGGTLLELLERDAARFCA